MKQLLILACAVIAMAATADKKPKPKKKAAAPAVVMTTAADSFAYAYGVYAGSMINKFKITDINWTVFNAAMKESLQKGDTGLLLDKETVGKVLNTYTLNVMYGKNKEEGLAYQNKHKALGYTTTASGLMYRIIRPGNGIKPRPSDTALAFYTGRYTDSSIFDSNQGRKPMKTACNGGVIAGFQEALQLMDEGCEAEFIIPYQLAYGAEGNRNPYTGEMSIEPYKTLHFTITLVRVIYRI